MRHHVDAFFWCTVPRENIAEIRVIENPVRVICQHLAADPDDFDMVDLTKLAQDRFELAGFKCQGISTGQQYIRDLLMLTDVVNPFRNIPNGLAFVTHEQSFAETEPADTPADIGQEQESGLTVFMLQARFFGKIFFARRIETSPSTEFRRIGDDYPAKRIVSVFPVNERQVILVGAEWECVNHRLHCVTFLGSEPDKVVKLGYSTQVFLIHVFHLPCCIFLKCYCRRSCSFRIEKAEGLESTK